jgi:hypothetical protein
MLTVHTSGFYELVTVAAAYRNGGPVQLFALRAQDHLAGL